MYVSVYVEEDDVLGDISTEKLAKVLVGRDDWQKYLRTAERTAVISGDIDSDMLQVIEKFQLGRPIEDDIRIIADGHYGKVI